MGFKRQDRRENTRPSMAFRYGQAMRLRVSDLIKGHKISLGKRSYGAIKKGDNKYAKKSTTQSHQPRYRTILCRLDYNEIRRGCFQVKAASGFQLNIWLLFYQFGSKVFGA